MAKASLEIKVHDEDNLPHLSYAPREGADFKPFDMVIPRLSVTFPTKEDFLRPDLLSEKPTDEGTFRIEAQEKVRACCGNVACKASLAIASAGLINEPNLRILAGATIHCNTTGCPLDNPPMAEDNEPLSPLPIPPALQSHAEPTEAVL